MTRRKPIGAAHKKNKKPQGCAFLALWVVSCSVFAWVLLCASVVCLSLLVCLPFVLLVSSLRPLCALGLSVLRLVVVCGRLPPSAPSVALVWRPVLLFYWSLSLVSGCFLRRPGCLAFMLGVLWYFASSLHFAPWQQRLCGVFDSPSAPWGICGCGALCSLIRDPP